MHNHTDRQTTSVKSLSERHVAVCRFEGAGKELHYLRVVQQFTTNCCRWLEGPLWTVQSLQIPPNFFWWRVICTFVHVSQNMHTAFRKVGPYFDLSEVADGLLKAKLSIEKWDLLSKTKQSTASCAQPTNPAGSSVVAKVKRIIGPLVALRPEDVQQ